MTVRIGARTYFIILYPPVCRSCRTSLSVSPWKVFLQRQPPNRAALLTGLPLFQGSFGVFREGKRGKGVCGALTVAINKHDRILKRLRKILDIINLTYAHFAVSLNARKRQPISVIYLLKTLWRSWMFSSHKSKTSVASLQKNLVGSKTTVVINVGRMQLLWRRPLMVKDVLEILNV